MITITLTGPDGSVVATHKVDPQDWYNQSLTDPKLSPAAKEAALLEHVSETLASVYTIHGAPGIGPAPKKPVRTRTRKGGKA